MNFAALFIFELIIPILLVSSGLINDWPRIKNSSANQNLISALSLAFIIPIIEELVGRLWIVYNRIYISWSLSTASGIIIYKLFGSNLNLPWYENYLWLSISILESISIFYFIKSKNQDSLERFWKNNQRKIILLSAVLFSILHYRHYEISLEIILLLPLVFAFYFTSGLILGYARVRYGFIYCCILHILYNSLLLSIKYVS
jgi:membrane protease YdiL (CAAX protease family)